MFNNSTWKKRCAIYCRVSTDEQVQNWNWLEIQKESLLNYIKANNHNFTINKNNIYIDEWKSWASKEEKDRPALFKMFNDAQNKEFDVVLVWKIDRFFRKTLYLLEWVDFLDSLWIWFISITQNFDTTQAFWKMMLQMMWVIAELERELIKERTNSWILAVMKKWKWWRGLYPYWYKKDKEGYLVIDEEESKIVKMIFNLLVNKGYTLNKILDKLNALNVETSTYKWKLWNKRLEQLKHKNHWHRMTIQRIVTNQIYTWVLIQNRYRKTRKDKHKTERPKEEWIISDCPKIINKDLFSKAQYQLEKNRNYSRRNKKEWVEYMLSTLLYDKETWYKFSWYMSMKWTINYRLDIRNKSKEKIPYKWISGNKIETIIWNKISNVLKNPSLILEELKKIDKNNNWIDIKKEILLLNDNILKIKNHSKNLLKLTDWLSNESISDIKELLEDNNLKILNIEKEINKLKGLELSVKQKQEQLNDLVELSSRIMLELDKLDYQDRTKICRLFIDRIEIEKDNIEITLLVPITWKNREKWNYKKDVVKDFFSTESKFINQKIAPKEVNLKDYLLCNVNGRKCETRTHNPTLPKRVR